jgi:hypothetical protein
MAQIPYRKVFDQNFFISAGWTVSILALEIEIIGLVFGLSVCTSRANVVAIRFCIIAKLSPSSSSSWAELALISTQTTTTHPLGK